MPDFLVLQAIDTINTGSMILYFYLPYTFSLLLMLAPAARKPHKPRSNLPKVSIIIPTMNERNVILSTLRSLKRINYPDYEIIVVDSGNDGTDKAARKYAKVIKDRQGRGKWHAVNVGIKNAKGEVLYFLDADTVPERDTLKNIVSQMGNDEVISGSVVMNGNTPIAKICRLQTSFSNLIQTVASRTTGAMITGKNFAIHKKVFEKVGLFEESLMEDINFTGKLLTKGIKTKFLDYRCNEQAPSRFSWYVKQQRRWAVGSQREGIKILKSLSPEKILVQFPILMNITFSAMFSILFIIYYLVTQKDIFIYPVFLAFAMYLVTTIKFLSPKDVVMLPLTFTLVGIFTLYFVLEAIILNIFGRKVVWERTQKI